MAERKRRQPIPVVIEERQTKQKPKREPWHPAPWDKPDAYALQALSRGEATPDQQKRALKWIIYNACMTYERTFIAGNPDASQVIAGRREAGLDIVKLLNLNLGALSGATQEKT